MTLDVTFVKDADRDDIDRAVNDIERAIVREFPQTTRIFVEPEDLESTQAASDRVKSLIAARKGK